MSVFKTGEVQNIFGDGKAFVEHWDFSRANMTQENRINAITQVASICYKSPTALGSEKLYNRLMAESMGLPSSSFEFVPVLLDRQNHMHAELLCQIESKVIKYGEFVEDGRYLLTNYRTLVYEHEQNSDKYTFDIRDILNTEKECEIIKKHFNVFLFFADIPTRSQMERHRVNWQELSRRYVSGKKEPFSFYLSEKMDRVTTQGMTTEQIFNLCLEHYNNLLDSGVKPEEARRVIPQAAYSQYWGGFQPEQLANFLKLRMSDHAQKEIRHIATAMADLSGSNTQRLFENLTEATTNNVEIHP